MAAAAAASPSSAKPAAPFGVSDDGAAPGKGPRAWGTLHASSCIMCVSDDDDDDDDGAHRGESNRG